MNYVYQRVEHSKVVRGADGKYTGSRSVFTHETDKDGNLKEVSREEYDLNDKGEWQINPCPAVSLSSKLSEDGKKVEVSISETPNLRKKEVEKKIPVGKFKDGDILKAEYSDHNVYAAYKDDTTAYWILATSLFPGKNILYGVDGLVGFKEAGFNFDDLDRATRDEVFSVEKFIEANTGFRWDWRNKELVRV